MKHLLILGTVAALGAIPAGAFAADAPAGVSASPATSGLSTPGARYTLVDADGRVVAELISEGVDRLRVRLIGTTVRSTAQPLGSRVDRTFHPDYSHALTPSETSAAWQAELDRLIPPVFAGGG